MGRAQLQRVADAPLNVFWDSQALFDLMMRPKAHLLEQVDVLCCASHSLMFLSHSPISPADILMSQKGLLKSLLWSLHLHGIPNRVL